MVKQNKSFLDRISGSNKDSDYPEESEPRREENVLGEKEDDRQYNISSESGRQAAEGWGDEELEEGQLAIDVYQDNDYVVIKSIVGGIRPEDLDLAVTSDMVTIKGSRERNEEIAEENYYYQECFWGSFSRSVILPCDIKTDQVEASMKNGILTIRMPKVEKNSATKIEVRGE